MTSLRDAVAGDGKVWALDSESSWDHETPRPCWSVGRSVTLQVPNPGADWRYLAFDSAVQELLSSGADLRVSFLLGGAAAAAGLRLGRERYMVPLDKRARPLHVSLEIGDYGRKTTFTVEGRLVEAWHSPTGILEEDDDKALSLAVFAGAQVEFSDIAVHAFDAPCAVSVVVSCHKFAQRLRVATQSWVGQDAPTGSYEVIVVTPGNPDGVSEQFAAFASSYPLVRLRHLALDGPPNKGWLLNEATKRAVGEVLWFTDADCVYPRDSVGRVLQNTKEITITNGIYCIERRHLGRSLTDAALCRKIDVLVEFDRLYTLAAERPAQTYPWGYAQIMAAVVAREIPFREELDSFAHHDAVFLDDARRAGHAFLELSGLSCLHLSHPFAWYGTHHFL